MISLPAIPEGTLYRCTMSFFKVTAQLVHEGKRCFNKFIDVHPNDFILSTGQVIEGDVFVFYLPKAQVNVGIISNKLRDYFEVVNV